MSDNTTPASMPDSSSDDERDILTTTGAEARRSSFGPSGAAGMPAEKSSNFRVTVRRLGEILGAEKLRLGIIAVLTVVSVSLIVVGPRLLGNATDIIVEGITGDGAIDFDELRNLLLFLGGLYLVSFALAYGQAYMLAGVVQRSMFALRESVEPRLNRLPLPTSTVSRAAICSVASPTTSTTSRRASSKR